MKMLMMIVMILLQNFHFTRPALPRKLTESLKDVAESVSAVTLLSKLKLCPIQHPSQQIRKNNKVVND